MSYHYHVEMEEPPMDFDEMTQVVFAKSWRTVKKCIRYCKRNGLRIEISRFKR